MAADIIPGTIYRAYRGGDDELAESWVDRQISQNEAERERRRTLTPKEREVTAFRIPFTDVDVKFGDFENIADNLGYSLGNAVAMGAARVGTKVTIGAIPYVGKVGSKIIEPMAGAAAGIAFSARVTKDQFVDDLKKEWMKAHKGELLTPDLQAQWADFYKSIASDATIYGLWEAVPETASNMIGWGIMRMGKGKAAQAVVNQVRQKMTNKVGKIIAKKLGVPVAKLGAMWTEELITEMITTKKQSEIEFARGLRDKPLGWMESLKAVAPAVMLSTPLMAAGFKGAQKIADGATRFVVKPKPEIETTDKPPAPGPEAAVPAINVKGMPVFQRIEKGLADGTLTTEDIETMREGMPEGHPLSTALGGLIGQPEASTAAAVPAARPAVELSQEDQAHQDNLSQLLKAEYPERDISVEVVSAPEREDLKALKNVGGRSV